MKFALISDGGTIQYTDAQSRITPYGIPIYSQCIIYKRREILVWQNYSSIKSCHSTSHDDKPISGSVGEGDARTDMVFELTTPY